MGRYLTVDSGIQPDTEQITVLWDKARGLGLTRRKFLALLAAGGAAAVLAACSGPKTVSPSTPTATSTSPPPITSSPTSTASAPGKPSSGQSSGPQAKPSSAVVIPGNPAKPVIGLQKNDPRAWPGYTLFAPKHYTHTYLINNKGEKVHEWGKARYEPGQAWYLMPNGHLFRACMTRGPLSTGGGEGGRLEEYDWDDNLVWELDWSTNDYMQHHDFWVLPNGNVLLMCVERKTYDQCVAAGCNPNFLTSIKSTGYMAPDSVYEVKPIRPKGAEIVWKWSIWDHLIQDFDSSKANYGDVAAHPELLDVNGLSTDYHSWNMPTKFDRLEQTLKVFFNHMNSITYRADWDQIMLSDRGHSEIYVIDHSTTTAEAASHQGGKYGKGGDFLYRWGNPYEYRAGTVEDEKLYQQHNATWIDANCPGAGDILVYNNNTGKPYSSINQWTPPVDAQGRYTYTKGSAYGPKDFNWIYKANPPESLYDEDISGAQRLPNGNTLICSGTHGRFIEVTLQSETVWEYICPVQLSGPMTTADGIMGDPARATAGEQMNASFRVLRYPLDYPAFQGRDLTPAGTIEKRV